MTDTPTTYSPEALEQITRQIARTLDAMPYGGSAFHGFPRGPAANELAVIADKLEALRRYLEQHGATVTALELEHAQLRRDVDGARRLFRLIADPPADVTP